MDLHGLRKKLVRGIGALCLGAGILLFCPQDSQAAMRQAEVQTRSYYTVTIEAPVVDVFASAGEDAYKISQVKRGQTYEAVGSPENGWVKIRTGGRDGFIKTAGKASVVERTRETVDLAVKTRREVVEYALQFVGGTYRYGGTDPNNGVDCSGFTRYVLNKAASVSIPHSSRGQAECGESVSLDQMQPGDLLFYSGSGGINHVALYIGDGQVVHASTEKTGIKTSPYNYREPVKIVSLLS